MAERKKVLWILESGTWRIAVVDKYFVLEKSHNKAGKPKWDQKGWYGTIEQCAQGCLRHLSIEWADLPKGLTDACDEARAAAYKIRELLKPLDDIAPDPDTSPFRGARSA